MTKGDIVIGIIRDILKDMDYTIDIEGNDIEVTLGGRISYSQVYIIQEKLEEILPGRILLVLKLYTIKIYI